jgi:hypothetical protein
MIVHGLESMNASAFAWFSPIHDDMSLCSPLSEFVKALLPTTIGLRQTRACSIWLLALAEDPVRTTTVRFTQRQGSAFLPNPDGPATKVGFFQKELCVIPNPRRRSRPLEANFTAGYSRVFSGGSGLSWSPTFAERRSISDVLT